MTTGQSKANHCSESKEKDGEYERIREKARNRLKKLAKHKEPHVAWHTCVGPQVRWGTQEMLWPVSPRAMQGSATPRICALSTPKKDFQAGTVHYNRPMYYYSSGRASVIWSVSEGAKEGAATERVESLAQPKAFHGDLHEHKPQFFYSCGRVTPIWPVSRGAMGSNERPRTTTLAGHRPYHADFKDERPIQSVVSAAARTTRPNEHISSLAMPKKRSEGPFRAPQWPVSDQVKTSVATGHCVELACSKPLAEGFQHAKEVEWPISKGAKRAQASGRIIELAQPISRASMDHLQFNPNAFTVKESALKGVIPGRIEDLAVPMNR
ncbi:sperm microtubule associated protein 2-like isoform X2 [Littorina saxatilis]|uniref:Uncharacterized protein n=1 Tax=Littorina saxatilis TaxID=31220 RepID=A0AAN9BRA8_9CAEN